MHAPEGIILTMHELDYTLLLLVLKVLGPTPQLAGLEVELHSLSKPAGCVLPPTHSIVLLPKFTLTGIVISSLKMLSDCKKLQWEKKSLTQTWHAFLGAAGGNCLHCSMTVSIPRG